MAVAYLNNYIVHWNLVDTFNNMFLLIVELCVVESLQM